MSGKTWARLIGLIVISGLAQCADAIQYQYDEAGRLSRAEYDNGYVIEYSYDANGNLLQRSITQQAVAGVLSFAQIEVDVDEGVGSVTLEVTRNQFAMGSASVEFDFGDLDAVNGVDYTGTPGTLNWPDGDFTSRNVVVPILDDDAFEADERFEVSLANPSANALLGTNTTLSVRIVDNETNIFNDSFEN